MSTQTTQTTPLPFESFGQSDGPVLLLQGGISADCRATSRTDDERPGWWQDFIGPGAPLDTARYRVLCVGFVGGLDNPRERVPGTDAQADAIAETLDALGVERPEAFVGASYGGMVGLVFAARYRRRLGSLIAISAPARPHPRATAWRSLQRQIVRLGLETGRDDAGLAIARGLAMTTYRSAEEFAARFDRPPREGPPREGPQREGAEGPVFPVEDYLAAQGERFCSRFRADTFLRLSESIDRHRVDPAAVRTPTTLIGVDSDVLVPTAQLRELARGLGGPCRLHEVSSLFGHDAFLKERESIGGLVARALAAPPTRGVATTALASLEVQP